MALGTVTVINQNLGQGAVPEIERYFLFIGVASSGLGELIHVNAQSDLDEALGAADSPLKTQLIAARLNGGPEWSALVAPVEVPGADAPNWAEAVDAAMAAGYSVEAVVVCTPSTIADDLQKMHEKALDILSRYQRRLFFMACVPGILAAQSWSEYLGERKALTGGLLAPRVLIVPLLHGNDLGALAGRLANVAASIADSPMRVATGPVVGLGPEPVDKDGAPLSLAHLEALDADRYSVPQTYADYEGTYWGDGNLLDAKGSDFQVVEYLRIIDKICRRIRILLIQRVADRALNRTTASMEAARTALMRPLREMARSTVFAGQQFPGEIEAPADDDLLIEWTSKTAVSVYVVARPHNCPKKLTAYVMLDISND